MQDELCFGGRLHGAAVDYADNHVNVAAQAIYALDFGEDVSIARLQQADHVICFVVESIFIYLSVRVAIQIHNLGTSSI